MGMTDEELHAAQPETDFKFNMYDKSQNWKHRDVVVPNWIARDGRWAEVYNALKAAEQGQIATATEQIVKALERAREFGRIEAETGHEPEGKYHVERWAQEGTGITANPSLGPEGPRSYGDCGVPANASAEKSRLDLEQRQHRGLRRPFDPAFAEVRYGSQFEL